jgi:hypothetical protein
VNDDQQTPPPPPTGDGGGPAAQPQLEALTPAQVEEILTLDIRGKLHFLCTLFAPHVLQTTNGEEELDKLAVFLAQEQIKIRDEVMPLLFGQDAVQSHPFFGVKLSHQANPGNSPLMVQGPKGFHPKNPSHVTFGTLGAVMLLLQPEYRGLLRILGVRYEFTQSNAPAERPKIQLASSMPKMPPNGGRRR